MTIPLPDNTVLVQYGTNIEEDKVALEDPKVYTLRLQATSAIPLVPGGFLGFFPTLELTVIDDDGGCGLVGVALWVWSWGTSPHWN